MDLFGFENWLLNKYSDTKTVSSRKSNCLRVEQFEGDLDIHFKTDKCSELLNKLTYTKDDEINNRNPRHNIPINGNIFNGTSTLKQAINLYVKFRGNETSVKILSKNNIKIVTKTNNREIIDNGNVLIKIFRKEAIDESVEFKKVYSIAHNFLNYLNDVNIKEKINEKNKIDASSAEIQNIFIEKLIEMGFSSEKNDLFREYNKRLRPDYYKELSHKTGIIIEVERGKTIHNNMDLLDMWKCHICSVANYLFLIVPKYRYTNKGSKMNVFESVVNRIKCFFEVSNYINVDGVFIFGY
jgi:hypothetical protein